MNILDDILSNDNLNQAYEQVMNNKGACKVDKMELSELKDYLKIHGQEIKELIRNRKYKPQPVLRVEIPKDNGKKRMLGILSVVDRVIQQAISQVLTEVFDEQFNDNSYGFRPGLNAHKAIDKTLEYMNEGYKWIVDIDLKRFFDTVNHDRIMRLISRTIDDGDVISLIRKFLTSGVMVDGKLEKTLIGTPQGGNLSPLLSNIMLNELDAELEKRNLKFVRYADDCVIFVKSEMSATRF
jgi:group II intron reverse transcriptase/maturase